MYILRTQTVAKNHSFGWLNQRQQKISMYQLTFGTRKENVLFVVQTVKC